MCQEAQTKCDLTTMFCHGGKPNSTMFPVLSDVANDVFAIQVSYVAPESVFSTSGRILDPFHSYLTPYMIEAPV